MAQMVLVMGESGTGKSTSLRNCDPATTAVVNPVGKPLPFKGKFDMLNSETDAAKITRYMEQQVKAGKKLIVVDDFQYILAVPYMNRIKETGWDKYNDFGANYFEIIEICKDLPADVVVAYMTHLETLDNGLTTVKLIGKLLREKITIEGLFTVVLRTGVAEGKYYFFTQNSGKDTVKSPLGMFPAYAIDNDLNYVAEKIRSYYEIGDHLSDTEMQEADKAVASDLAKPDTNGRRARGGSSKPVEQTEQPSARKTRTHDEVEADNKAKIEKHMEDCSKAVDQIAGDREEVPWEEASKAMDTVPQPELETAPRRTRSERQSAAKDAAEIADEADRAKANGYFHNTMSDTYFMVYKGDVVPTADANIVSVTLEEYNAGLKRIQPTEASDETKVRQRKDRSVEAAAPETETKAEPEQAGARRRRTR